MERRHGPFARADRVQHPGQRDVIDIVAGGVRQRTGLPPARHARVDELRVAGKANLGTKAKSLHDARPQWLDQRVGRRDETQGRFDAFWMLEIDGHGRPATAPNVGLRARELEPQTGMSWPVDPDEIGAHVGKQRAAQWRWSDTGDLDDLNAGQGSGTLRDAHDIAPLLVQDPFWPSPNGNGHISQFLRRKARAAHMNFAVVRA